MKTLDSHSRRSSDARSLSIIRLPGMGVLALLLLPLIANAGVFELELVPVWQNEFPGVIPVDVDGDGYDELLLSREARNPQRWGITMTDADLGHLWSMWSADKRLVGKGAVDIDGDGELEILVQENVGDTANLLIFTSDRVFVKRIKVIEGWDGGFGFQGMFDVNGVRALLLSVIATIDLQPRGFLALDLETGERLWSYWTGFYPGDVEIVDLDGDGDSEIVLGSISTDNGSQANGTDDAHTYVVVLDHQGRRLWQRQIGGHSSRTSIEVADFDDDGIKEIVVMEETERAEYLGPDKLMILDDTTGKTKKLVETGKAYRGLVLCDLNRDGIPEIVAGNSDGVVRAFDAELEEVASFASPDSVGIKVTGAGDLDGDGHPEILATTRSSILFVLNDKLQEIGRYEVEEGDRVSAQLVRVGRTRRILLCCIDKPKFIMLDVYRRLAAPTDLSLGLLIPCIILFALTIALLLFSYHRRGRLVRRLLSDPLRGIIVLDSKGRIRASNRQAGVLMGVDEHAELHGTFAALKVPRQASALHTAILECIRHRVKSGTAEATLVRIKQDDKERVIEVRGDSLGSGIRLVSLSEVTEREFGRKVATWIPIAQQLAHGIKNPLSHIRLAIQRLEKQLPEAAKSRRYSRIVSAEVKRLLKLTDGFMRFTKLEPPRRETCSIQKLVEELRTRLEPTLPKGVEMVTEFPADLPLIALDSDQMATVFDHLADNALAAVGKRGVITIKALFVEKLDLQGRAIPAIEIRVTDTGSGIPPEYRAKVFEPYFSLKPDGTGLGLAMTRKIVADHGGTITLDSKEGLGTTFIITLPLGRSEE